jgi:hypothetical protein
MLAETLSCLIFVPVDVVKERLQIQRGNGSGGHHGDSSYKGSWDGLKTIWRVEGTRGIYRGYGATLLSFGPFSALYFMFYEELKSRAGLGASPAVTIANSCASGALAAWLTSPLDLVKLRMQV